MLSKAAADRLEADFKANTTWLQRYGVEWATIGIYISSPAIILLLLYHQTSGVLWSFALAPTVIMLTLYLLGYGDARDLAYEEAVMRYIKDESTPIEVLDNGAGIVVGEGSDQARLSGRDIARHDAGVAIIASVFSRLSDAYDAERFACALAVGGLSPRQISEARKEVLPQPWRKSEVSLRHRLHTRFLRNTPQL